MIDRVRQPAIRVFILDERAEVRERLHRLLDRQPDLRFVGEAENEADAARWYHGNVPDVAIIDVNISEDGIELCRRMLSEHPDVRCLVLAAFDDEQALIDVLLSGASGLLSEDASGENVAAAVRAAASGRWVLEPLVQTRRLHSAEDDGLALLEQLSERERQIAEHIAKGLTNREIAAQLHLGEKTVRNYISALLAKLRMRNRTQVATMLTQLAADHRRVGRSEVTRDT